MIRQIYLLDVRNEGWECPSRMALYARFLQQHALSGGVICEGA